MSPGVCPGPPHVAQTPPIWALGPPAPPRDFPHTFDGFQPKRYHTQVHMEAAHGMSQVVIQNNHLKGDLDFLYLGAEAAPGAA